ncbi:MAG: TolC family outer membrane protein [Alphaproteobacteria bacterium]|nr:TolC family outer membrane protein [Alphaproteobacteria bacterium]MDD9920099.1 TolC family outer membrane protein [Alphaproteobacteria bacterium]
MAYTKQLTLVALMAGTALTSHAQGMREAVEAAITNHPNVEMAEHNRDAIGHVLRQSKAAYRPTVDLTAGTGWEHTNSSTTRSRAARTNNVHGHRDLWRNEARLLVRQNLYNGYGTRSDVSEQKNRKESAKFNVVETKEITALQALEAYLNVMRARELVALGIANLKTHESYLNQISRRVTGGRGSQADLRQAEGRANLARANLVAYQGELRNAEADYLEVVGTMPKQLRKDNTPFRSLPASLETALDRAMANSPAIKSAQHDIKAAHAAVQEAKSVFCPRFDLEGNVGRNVNLDGVEGTNNEASVMLMMRYNLYRGGGDTARVKEQVERHGEATASLEQTRRLVEENMMLAWSGLQTSRMRLQPLNGHVLAAQQTRDAYEAQFDLGQRTLLDLLDSEIELFEAKTALINGKYAVDLAVYEVMAHAGDLVSTMTTQVASLR